MRVRVGFGFDVHKFAENRELWLGGIRLEHDRGLLGHSDADNLRLRHDRQERFSVA